MIAAVLAMAVAQLTSPQPAESGTPPPTPISAVPAVSAPASPGAMNGDASTAQPVIDRLPRRMPIEAPRMTTGDIMIRNTGSTNTEGYTIVVHADYTADVYSGGQSDRKTLAEPQAKWLFNLVKADRPIDQLGAARCMKSTSFGTRTFITSDGVTSPDLSCGGGDSIRELNRTIGIIMTQLGVSPAPGRFRRRLL